MYRIGVQTTTQGTTGSTAPSNVLSLQPDEIPATDRACFCMGAYGETIARTMRVTAAGHLSISSMKGAQVSGYGSC